MYWTTLYREFTVQMSINPCISCKMYIYRMFLCCRWHYSVDKEAQSSIWGWRRFLMSEMFSIHVMDADTPDPETIDGLFPICYSNLLLQSHRQSVNKSHSIKLCNWGIKNTTDEQHSELFVILWTIKPILLLYQHLLVFSMNIRLMFMVF